MKIQLIWNICIVSAFFITSNSAYSQSIIIPHDTKQRLSINNLNFTGTKFFDAYMSKDVSQRHLAEMFLIGVLDSTEGKLWCGYKIALPGSIQELIYIGFKKESEHSLKRRASEIIISIMSKKLPCKDRL